MTSDTGRYHSRSMPRSASEIDRGNEVREKCRIRKRATASTLPGMGLQTARAPNTIVNSVRSAAGR